MPSAWRAHVIGETLRRAGIAATVRETDVYGLTDDERHAVLDALVAGADQFPMVLVAGRLACAGDIDTDAIGRFAKTTADGDVPGGGGRAGCC